MAGWLTPSGSFYTEDVALRSLSLVEAALALTRTPMQVLEQCVKAAIKHRGLSFVCHQTASQLSHRCGDYLSLYTPEVYESILFQYRFRQPSQTSSSLLS